MLYLFDLDGTLISGYMDNLDKDYDTWTVLPRRKAMLNRLLLRGDTICIVTNQGGVAYGFVNEDQADTKIALAIQKLGLFNPRSNGDPQPRQVYACYHHEKGIEPWNNPFLAVRRKPNPHMLIEAMNDHSEAAASGVLMVGRSGRAFLLAGLLDRAGRLRGHWRNR